jgi:hypothetical protein
VLVRSGREHNTLSHREKPKARAVIIQYTRVMSGRRLKSQVEWRNIVPPRAKNGPSVGQTLGPPGGLCRKSTLWEAAKPINVPDHLESTKLIPRDDHDRDDEQNCDQR